jgi:hypothetical protein
VSEITPTMMPAQAHTAMICTDIAPASSNALKIERIAHAIGRQPRDDGTAGHGRERAARITE